MPCSSGCFQVSLKNKTNVWLKRQPPVQTLAKKGNSLGMSSLKVGEVCKRTKVASRLLFIGTTEQFSHTREYHVSYTVGLEIFED